MQSLTQQQERHLRRLGHDLKPVVRTGNAGLTDAVVAELGVALRDHELVKIKLAGSERNERRATTDRVLSATGALEVQQVGQVVLLYRPNPERRHPIALP